MSQLFRRSNDVTKSFSSLFKTAGWITFIVNLATLVFYFWEKYARTQMFIRVTGSIVVSILILGIEFATLAVLFEPDIINSLFKDQRGELSERIQGFTTSGMAVLSAATFWYDWTINVANFKVVGSVPLDYQILAVALIFMSELLFWIHNICEQIGSKK